MIRKSFLQMLVLIVMGTVIGLVYNTISPQSIPLRGGQEARLEQQGARTIDLEEVRYYLEQPGVVLIDARSPEEFSLGHIPKAENLPDEEFKSFFPKLKSKLMTADLIIVYCSGGSCGSSEDLALKLLNEGIGESRIAVFSGGLPAWMKAKLPIERSADN